MDKKICTKYGVEQSIAEEAAIKSKIYRKNNKEKIKVRNKKYREANKDRINAQIKAYHETNRDEIKIYKKIYHQKNKVKMKIYNKIYYETNKDKIKKQTKTYYETHKEKIGVFRRIYEKQRRKVDPKFRLNRNISKAIWLSLKESKKGAHWEFLVGYTIETLKKHLEKLFIKGMTWENYGKWHIDHEIPISAFNFTNSEHRDFSRAWALSNLQPMWASENHKKYNKLDKHFQPSLQM